MTCIIVQIDIIDILVIFTPLFVDLIIKYSAVYFFGTHKILSHIIYRIKYIEIK